MKIMGQRGNIASVSSKARWLMATLSILIFMQSNVNAQIVSSQTLKNGRVLHMESFGELILGPDRLLNKAKVRVKGQYVHRINDDLILITSEIVSAVSSENIQLTDKNQTYNFNITIQTRLCDGTKAIRWKDIKIGEMVSVVSKTDNQDAVSIRKGPLILGGLPPFNPEYIPENYTCEQN
jgi:hypothetical protein